MCKINGHNLFTYAFQPVWNWKKLYSSKERDAKLSAAKKKAANKMLENSKGNEVSKTASIAQVHTPKNQSLSSLRVPLEQNVGTSLGGASSVGLNLGG